MISPWRAATLAAFVAARRLGADGVELDVRRTADGALAVHHDATIAGDDIALIGIPSRIAQSQPQPILSCQLI